MCHVWKGNKSPSICQFFSQKNEVKNNWFNISSNYCWHCTGAKEIRKPPKRNCMKNKKCIQLKFEIIFSRPKKSHKSFSSAKSCSKNTFAAFALCVSWPFCPFYRHTREFYICLLIYATSIFDDTFLSTPLVLLFEPRMHVF